MGDPIANLRFHQDRLRDIHPAHRKGRHKNPHISELRADARSWVAAMAKGKERGFKGHIGAELRRPRRGFVSEF